MKIALANVGNESWIGGLYYVGNLIRALRSLPGEERPELLLVTPRRRDLRYFEEIDGLAETLIHPPLTTRLLRRAAGSIRDRLPNVFGNRDPVESMNSAHDRSLSNKLEKEGISVLFPCSRAMDPRFTVPWIGWTPDLQHRHFPEYFPETEWKRREQNIALLLSASRLMAASSEDVVRDFERFFPGSRKKLRVLNFRTVPLAGWFEVDPEAACARLNLPPRFLVIPNQFFVHKNHKVAFDAVKILKDRGVDIHIVCTGATSDWRRPAHFEDLREQIAGNGLEDRIRILGLVPRQDQIQVLRRAMAILQPSLFEGWSTVIEDARALGKPAFVSDISVHRRQDLPSAVYFDPADPEGLADLIEEKWNDLPTGPGLDEEATALEYQQTLVQRYARDFMATADEATSGNRWK